MALEPLVLDWSRIAAKFLGLAASIGAVAAIHFFFRFYSPFRLSVTLYALALLLAPSAHCFASR